MPDDDLSALRGRLKRGDLLSQRGPDPVGVHQGRALLEEGVQPREGVHDGYSSHQEALVRAVAVLVETWKLRRETG